MKQTNKMIDIFAILLCCILFIASILIGSPLKNNTIVINCLLILLTIIYSIYFKIKKQEFKLFRNKVDIMLAILMLSSFIPLIFKTHISLEGTIEYILRYITLFCMYFLTKQIISKDKKYIQYLMNITILSGIVIFMFGMDNLTYQTFQKFLESIDSIIIKNRDFRFFSTFAYGNTLAIFMTIINLFSINQYVEEKKKYIKPIYGITALLSLIAIILSVSRAVWILYAIAIIIYIIILKKKEIKIQIIGLMAIIVIISFIYSAIFEKLLLSKSYLAIYIFLALCLICTYIILLKIKNLNKINIIIRNKKILIVILIFALISITVFILIGLKLTKPLNLFNGVYNTNLQYVQSIPQIESLKEYNFEFNITSKTNFDVKDAYEIQIVEKNKYGDEIHNTKTKLAEYIGILPIIVNTNPNTVSIDIIYKSLNKVTQKQFVVNNLKINGKNIILDYAYLPKSIVEKIQSINLKSRSVWERGNFLNDGIKIIKDNCFFGIGGEGWKYKLSDMKEYSYFTNEVHSYPIEIFMEFGLLGFVAFIGIAFSTIINIIKKYKKEGTSDITYITIVIALLLVVIHSMIDFDMSFMYIMLLVFMFLGIINSYEEKILISKNNSKITFIIFIIFLLIAMIINITNLLARIFIKNVELSSLFCPYKIEYRQNKIDNITQNDNIIQEIKKLQKDEPYYYNISNIKLFTKCSLEQIKQGKIDDGISNIEYIFEIITNKKGISKYDVGLNIFMDSQVLEIGQELERLSQSIEDVRVEKEYKKCYQYVKDESEDLLEEIKNQDRNRLNDEEIKNKLEIVKRNMKIVDNKLEKNEEVEI